MDCHRKPWLSLFFFDTPILSFPFDWGWYTEVISCSVPIMLCETLLTSYKLLPLVFNLNLHPLRTYNLILMEELSNGGGTFIFMGFIYSMQTSKSLKPSTSGRLYMSIPICCITSVLMGMLWSSLDILSHFSLLLTLVAFLNQFFNIAFDLVPEKFISNLFYCWILFHSTKPLL